MAAYATVGGLGWRPQFFQKERRLVKLNARRDDAVMESHDYMDGFLPLKEFIELSLTTLKSDFTTRMDALENNIGAQLSVHERRFDRIDRKLDEHDQRFDAMDNRFNAMDKRVECIESQIVTIAGDIFVIKDDLSELKREVRVLSRKRRET